MIRSIFSSLISAYLLILVVNGDLSLYVNPVYMPLILSMSLILFLISTWSVWIAFKESEYEFSKIKNNTNILILIFLLVILIFPASSLSSELAASRNANLGYGGDFEADVSPLLNRSTADYKVADWVKLKSTEADLSRLSGKDVQITGFSFRQSAAQYSEDNFMVGRYVITCCAVDATPIGLEIQVSEDVPFEDGQWLEVTGETTIKTRENQDYLVVEVTELTKIEEPDNPYEV